MTVSAGQGAGSEHDPIAEQALAMRLRDLALVELDALTLGAAQPSQLVAAFADDVADALRQARARIATLRGQLGGADPLGVVEVAADQRASDAGRAAAAQVAARLGAQAEAARSLARLAELAATLAPKLFEADRRRGSGR